MAPLLHIRVSAKANASAMIPAGSVKSSSAAGEVSVRVIRFFGMMSSPLRTAELAGPAGRQPRRGLVALSDRVNSGRNANIPRAPMATFAVRGISVAFDDIRERALGRPQTDRLNLFVFTKFDSVSFPQAFIFILPA
jgi:hypothetical protein